MIRIAAVTALVLGAMQSAGYRVDHDRSSVVVGSMAIGAPAARGVARLPSSSYVPALPLPDEAPRGADLALGAGDVLPTAPAGAIPGDLQSAAREDRGGDGGPDIVAVVPSVQPPTNREARGGAHYTATYLAPILAGNVAGCGGVYFPDDPTYAAVGYELARVAPCGARLEVCGAGGCVTVTRKDTCGECDHYGNMIDLSEAANMAVCGRSFPASCAATVTQ